MGSETASQRSFDRTREAPKAPTRELSPWSARRAMTLANSTSNRPQRTRSRSESRDRSQEKGGPIASRSSRESTGKTRSRGTTSGDARETSKSASLRSERETSVTSGKRRAPSDSPEPYQRSRDRSRDRRRDGSSDRKRERSTDKRRDRSREHRRVTSKDRRGSGSRDRLRDRSRERPREPRNGHRDRSRDRNRSPERRGNRPRDRYRDRSSPRSRSRSRSRSTTRSTTRKRKLPISRSPSPAPYRSSHKRRDRSPSPPRHHRRHSRSPTPNKHHKRHKRSSPSPSRSRSPARHRSRKPLPSQAQQLAIRDLDSSSLPPTQTGGAPAAKEKPNFKPTGLLAKEANLVAGTKVSLKYHEPPEARKPPPSAPWRLFIFKGPDTVGTVELGKQSCWLFGRTREVADVWLEHPSCSGQHAAIQFRYVEKVVEEDEFGGRKKVGRVKPYLIDLESSNGTELNGESVEGGRYVELRDKDVVTFGGSEREYMIMLPPKE